MLKSQSFDFSGKTAIVTGGSRGIGRAIAKGLHEAGAKVYVLARSTKALASLATECPGIQTRVCDVSDWKATRKVIQEIPEERIDSLVNNAAILVSGTFMTCKPEDFEAAFRTNLFSILNISQVVGAKMIANGGGSIVNISSLAALVPASPICAYSVFKAALDHMTKIMAQELGPRNIRVNSLNPGYVDTAMMDEYLEIVIEAVGFANKEEARAMGNQKIPLPQKSIQLQELVNTTLFMLSSAAPMLHGAIVPVDGGILVSGL